MAEKQRLKTHTIKIRVKMNTAFFFTVTESIPNNLKCSEKGIKGLYST